MTERVHDLLLQVVDSFHDHGIQKRTIGRGNDVLHQEATQWIGMSDLTPLLEDPMDLFLPQAKSTCLQ